MSTEAITQAAHQIGPLVWNEGDPVSLRFKVNRDWSGDYQCQIRRTRKASGQLLGELTVTATWDPDEVWTGSDGSTGVGVTTFILGMTAADSELVREGKYFADIQQVDGVTRLWARVCVEPQVTVLEVG